MKKYRKRVLIEEKKVKQLHDKGYSDHKIAKELGASQTGVMRVRQRMGIYPHDKYSNKKRKERDDTPKEIYANALSNSRHWKSNNMSRVTSMYRQWLKDHSSKHKAYMNKLRQQQNRFIEMFVYVLEYIKRLLGFKNTMVEYDCLISINGVKPFKARAEITFERKKKK